MPVNSAQRRALTRAALAWRSGHPHQAWEILRAAGMEDVWPTFRQTAFRVARRRYLARMGKYRPSH